MYVYMYLYACMYICIYICICIHTYIYIHINTYRDTFGLFKSPVRNIINDIITCIVSLLILKTCNFKGLVDSNSNNITNTGTHLTYGPASWGTHTHTERQRHTHINTLVSSILGPTLHMAPPAAILGPTLHMAPPADRHRPHTDHTHTRTLKNLYRDPRCPGPPEMRALDIFIIIIFIIFILKYWYRDPRCLWPREQRALDILTGCDSGCRCWRTVGRAHE